MKAPRVVLFAGISVAIVAAGYYAAPKALPSLDFVEPVSESTPPSESDEPQED